MEYKRTLQIKILVALFVSLHLSFIVEAQNITPASNPVFTLSKEVPPKNILLGICNHSSAFEIYELFVVRNDTGYLTASSTNLHSFPNLLMKNANAPDPRPYRCGLNYQGKKYISDKYVLTLKDVLRLQLNISFFITNHDYHYYLHYYPRQILREIRDSIDSHYQHIKTFGVRLIEWNSEYNYTVLNMAISKNSTEKITDAVVALRRAFMLYRHELHRYPYFYYQFINFTSVIVSPLDWCSADDIEGEEFKGKLHYNVTRASSSPISKQCPNGKHENVYRYCFENFPNKSEWSKVNFTQCRPDLETTVKLKTLNRAKITSQTVVEVSENLKQIVKDDRLNNTDIDLVTSVIEKITDSLYVTQKNENQTDVITENILDVASKLLDANDELLTKSNEKSNTSSTFLRSLDIIAVYVTRQSTRQRKVFRKQNIALAIQNNSNSFTFVATEESNLLDIQSVEHEVESQASLAQLFVPQSLLKRANSTLVYSFIYRSALLFSQPFGRKTIQSIIMAASVPEKKISNLHDPVVITFQDNNINDTRKNKFSTCQFWVPEENAWSKEGCKTLPGKLQGTVRCECTHLTNFALLLDINQSGYNPLSLKIITWIGCAISIFGLLLTVISFTIFSNLRKKLPSKILLCFSCSLLVLLVLFVTGIERVKPRIGCQFIAALIQYSLLATFFWMSVEGWVLYHNFVKVFGGQKGQKKFIIQSSLFAWGGPFVITSITAGVATDYLGPKTKDDMQFCVVRGLPFYIGVVVPVILIFIKNLIVLVLVLRGITTSQFKKHRKRELMASARIAFACSILLGTTWIFGILAIGDLRYFFQCLFCVFNSLQGCFIFLFYTVRNTEARKHWNRALQSQKSRAYSTVSGTRSSRLGSSGDENSFRMKLVSE